MNSNYRNIDINDYVDEIKKLLPKNMKKEKVESIEYLIDKIYSVNNKKNKILKLKFDKQNIIYNKDISYKKKDLIVKKCLKETINILEKNNAVFKLVNFSYYIEKKENKLQLIYPTKYFMDIGKTIINSIYEKVDDIYKKLLKIQEKDIKIIEKGYIFEETTSSFSFKIVYVDNIQENIKMVKNIVHIIQYNNKSCFLNIIPIANITNKSIYLEIENNIEQQFSNLEIKES